MPVAQPVQPEPGRRPTQPAAVHRPPLAGSRPGQDALTEEVHQPRVPRLETTPAHIEQILAHLQQAVAAVFQQQRHSRVAEQLAQRLQAQRLPGQTQQLQQARLLPSLDGPEAVRLLLGDLVVYVLEQRIEVPGRCRGRCAARTSFGACATVRRCDPGRGGERGGCPGGAEQDGSNPQLSASKCGSRPAPSRVPGQAASPPQPGAAAAIPPGRAGRRAVPARGGCPAGRSARRLTPAGSDRGKKQDARRRTPFIQGVNEKNGPTDLRLHGSRRRAAASCAGRPRRPDSRRRRTRRRPAGWPGGSATARTSERIAMAFHHVQQTAAARAFSAGQLGQEGRLALSGRPERSR